MANETTQESERTDITLKLPQAAYKGLGYIVDHSSKLDSIFDSLSKCTLALDYHKVIPIVSTATGISSHAVQPILETLTNLSLLMDRLKLDPASFVAHIIDAAESLNNKSWKDKYLDNLKAEARQIADALAKTHANDILIGLAKSQNLTYAHENVLTEANIITELRPVFNDAGDKVLQMVLTHYLLVEYNDGRGPSRIQFAIDSTDISDIRKLCERAEKKTLTLKASFEGSAWHINIPRESD